MIDLESCNSHGAVPGPKIILGHALASILCSRIQLRFHTLCGRASAAAVLFTVVAVYFARSPRAEVRAAIKLTNFSTLLRTRPRVF
jgi:hypothetical protein